MGREAVAEAVSLGAALASRESVVEEEEDENPTADGKPVHRMARPIALTRQAKKERCAGAHADDDQEMKMSGSCLLSRHIQSYLGLGTIRVSKVCPISLRFSPYATTGITTIHIHMLRSSCFVLGNRMRPLLSSGTRALPVYITVRWRD